MADSAPAPTPAPAVETRPAPDSKPARAASNRRVQLFGLLAAIIVVVGLVYGAYWLIIGRTHVATDDAYVNADTAEITPQVAAQVAHVFVTDTQPVKQGQVLVQLDPTDAKVALDQAKAELDQATPARCAAITPTSRR